MNILGNEYGMRINGITHVSPREANDLCNMGAVIVDVRETYLNKYKTLEVPEVLYIPYSTIEKYIEILPKDKILLFIDSVGLRSKETVLLLQRKGFKNIMNIVGGVVDWEREHLSIQIHPEERLTGSCLCQIKTKRDIK